MPKVVYTNAKGLVQSTGTGFPHLDAITGNQANFSGTAVSGGVSDAEARAALHTGTPSASQILAATLGTDALNTTAYAGATAAASIYLPAADEGAHLALHFTAAPGGTNDLTIVASHATYESASESARQAAGGTAAVFAKGIVANQGFGNANPSNGSHTLLTIDMHATNCAISQNTVLHFYCLSAGVWSVVQHGAPLGTGSAMTFS
tara:strand:- start:2326 stop:2943 length:618 start_codon:yes stop_codon:yes gene_type:complete